MDKDHPLCEKAESLASRLASTVAEVQVDEKSVKPPEDFEKVLKRIEGRPLTADMYLDLLLRVAWEEVEGATGICLKAIRYDDLGGVTLKVRLLATKARHAGSQMGWSYSTMARVNGKVECSSSGSASLKYSRKREAYDDLEKAINKAVTSRSDVLFELTIEIMRCE